jgi:hypothetical protein
LAAINAAELAARRPLAGPAGVVSLLLASLGPLPAVIAAASLVLQHVVAAAMVARAFMPAVWRIVAVVASGDDDGAVVAPFPLSSPSSSLSFSHGHLPPTLDPVAATLVLLASAAAAAAGPAVLRAVAWFCAAAGGGAALASTVAAALTLASLKGGPVQQPLFSSSSPPTTTAADLLLGPVAAAAGAALVSSFATGVALPPAFSDDARQPARAVPRGMVGAVALAAVVQTLAALSLRLLPLTTTTITPPLVAARLLFSLAAALSVLGGVPALVLGAARLVCGAARHRLLPFAGFGRVGISAGCCRCRGRRFRFRARSPMAAAAPVAAAAVPLSLLLEASKATPLAGLLAVGFVATQAMVAVAVLLERSRDARAVAAGAEQQQPQQPQRQQEEERPPSAQPPPPPPPPPESSCSSSADGHVSIRSASPPPSVGGSDGAEARCGDPRWWARGAGATWLPRFLVGALAACSCGAASALGAAASLEPGSSSSSPSSLASPGDALWPLTALFGGWLVATATLHFCSVVTSRAAKMLAAEERAAAGAGGRGGGRRSDNNTVAFRAPGGPWLPSLSLFLLGVAGGAALPLSALLRWLILVAAATGAWLLYGLPAAQARATRWAAEDAAEEEARAAEAEEEGRRRWWEAEEGAERERAALEAAEAAGAAAAAGEAATRGATALGEGDEANHAAT